MTAKSVIQIMRTQILLPIASICLLASASCGADESSKGNDASSAGDARQSVGDGGRLGGTLSQQYPGDAWDLGNAAFIHTSNFEQGDTTLSMGSYTGDVHEVLDDAANANRGSHSLKQSFTLSGLEARGDASVRANAVFTSETGIYYVRYYMRYQEGTARPHHGNNTRMYSDGNDAGGTAGIRPNGNERFNTTIDIDGQGRNFFYTYWHEMRSGRCNDGSATPGCEGDQGSTYYYGNRFKAADQSIINRHEWHCYEYRVQANTPNQYDGAQSLWVDDQLVGEFRDGAPMGSWLRDNFYTMGEFGTGSSQAPFEGYNFRSNSEVEKVRVTFEIYQERSTLNNNRDDTANKTEEQAVFYDDIVIAKERIGCTVDL